MFAVLRRRKKPHPRSEQTWPICLRIVIRCLLLGIIVPLLTVFTAPATADTINWDVSIFDANQIGVPGSPIVFEGTITNHTGSELFLDTSIINFSTDAPASSYVKDYADEFLSTLGIIPTSGYRGPLFFVLWLPSVPTGSMGSGTFELTAESPAEPTTLSASFSATVTTVPEPSTATMILLAIGLVGSIWIIRRKETRT